MTENSYIASFKKRLTEFGMPDYPTGAENYGALLLKDGQAGQFANLDMQLLIHRGVLVIESIIEGPTYGPHRDMGADHWAFEAAHKIWEARGKERAEIKDLELAYHSLWHAAGAENILHTDYLGAGSTGIMVVRQKDGRLHACVTDILEEASLADLFEKLALGKVDWAFFDQSPPKEPKASARQTPETDELRKMVRAHLKRREICGRLLQLFEVACGIHAENPAYFAECDTIKPEIDKISEAFERKAQKDFAAMKLQAGKSIVEKPLIRRLFSRAAKSMLPRELKPLTPGRGPVHDKWSSLGIDVPRP